jgi:hypothetical protein
MVYSSLRTRGKGSKQSYLETAPIAKEVFKQPLISTARYLMLA